MKKLFKILVVFVLVLAMAVPVNAAEAVGKVDAFGNIPGDGQYINNKDHYQLDMVKPGILDSIRLVTNGAANLLFQLEVNLVNLTCTVLYYVSTIKIIDGLETKINGIQKNLYDGLFNNAFNLAFLFVGLFLAWLLLRNRYGEILNQLAKVFMVCFMAALLATNTSWLIKMDEEITASFSDYVAAAITGSSSGSGYAVDVAGQIWSTQVHQPWLTLEFGKYNYSESDIKALLNDLDPDSEPREEFVKSKNESNTAAFAESMRWERLVFTFLYLIPLLIKCLIVNAIVLLQLAFRVVKVFLYLLGIPVMILSLVPQLGGTKIIESWIKKIFEMSFMVVILSFTLSVILWFDGILWGFAGSMGWLTVIILQMGIAVVIFLFRNKILGIMETVQNVVRNPAPAAAQIRRSMDSIGSDVFTTAQRLDNRATQAVMSSGAYKQVASSADTIMHTWRDGLRDDIGSILPEGNVFQTPAPATAETATTEYEGLSARESNYMKKLENKLDMSKWNKATWDANLESANYTELSRMYNHLKVKSRPNLIPETATDALRYEGLAAVSKENAGMTEDIRPLLSLYKNPEFVRKDEPMAAGYEKKAAPTAAPQKRSTRQASSETSNNTTYENKRQTGQAGQGAASDLGLSQQKMYREAEQTRPTRKRPELEPTGTGSVIKQATTARPVNSRDIAQDKPPATRNDGLQTAAKTVISHDIAKDRRPTPINKEGQIEARPVTSRNIVQDQKPMAETDKPVASKPRPVKLEKGA